MNETFERAKTEEIKEYFNSIFYDKPSDFESDICKAAEEGKHTSVQYLVERYHADVEAKDKYEWTPINDASKNGHLEAVKYLYETCHVKITDRVINTAERNCKQYLKNFNSINARISIVRIIPLLLLCCLLIINRCRRTFSKSDVYR